MNNENKEKALQKPEVDKQGENKTSKKPSSIKSVIVFVFVLILFVALFIYFNNYIKQLEEKINKENLSSAGDIETMEQRISANTNELLATKNALAEIVAKQEILLSQSIEPQAQTNKDYALAEIEHLLIIASYNLQLEQDVSTALAAMEAADARLQGLGDPRVLEVRQQLVADMNSLRSLNQADLSGLGLYLSDLINRIDMLPLQANVVIEDISPVETNNQQSVNGIKHFFLLVWQELKSLVVITRDKDISRARLLPDEVYFLRANIKLELANARFAVFNRDTENFYASIGHIQNWINEYFDISDAAVRNIHESLDKMKKINLGFPQADINSSLESVRALIRNQVDTPETLSD